MTRKQCAKCPWKVDTDPRDIPNGYCEVQHANLSRTIAEPGSLANIGGELRLMACHESGGRRQLPCIGWLDHQINEGNNISLRIAASDGRIDMDYETVGEQHRRFEDTLPEDYDE